MKLNSISGLVSYVKDIEKTADFYEKLGFNIDTKSEDLLKVSLNRFSIEFNLQGEGFTVENQHSGLYVYVEVDDIEEFYEGVKQQGLAPTSEPKVVQADKRGFVLHDPDYVKLIFFCKI